MYQALYRKYRSQTFDEMVGQEVISKALKQAVETGKISHAYLFSGPRGTGKTSTAKIFSKAINCPNQSNGEPCNQCYICQAITEGSLEDVIEIDAASNNGVDEIRDIREKSTYAPSVATYKIYIIDEVHMLSTGAFNALLKTLEEPTDNVVFILATTELHKIPATILSRVQRFEFKAIRYQDIRDHLSLILDKEGYSYQEPAVELIARRAEGGMRDALSILDQAISLSTDKMIDTEIAEEITGSISLLALDEYVTHLREQDATAALDKLDVIFNQGKSMTRFLTDFLQYLRDLLIVKSGGANERYGQLFVDNLAFSNHDLFQMIEQSTKALNDINRGGHPKIYMEMLTIQLATPQETSDIPENIVEELNRLQTELSQLKQALKKITSNDKEQSILETSQKSAIKYKIDQTKIMTIMQETVEDSEKSRAYLSALKNAWNEILDSISPQNRALLLGSEPVLANHENAILAFDAAFNAEQTMRRDDLNDIVGNIMSKVAGFSPKIMAVPRDEFNKIRAKFAQQMRLQKEAGPEETVSEIAEKQPVDIPEGFDFLSEKIVLTEE